jgi:hypothetical protein
LYFIIVGILALLFYSCEQKKTELSLKSYSDIMNKFQIDIPEYWNVEKFHDEYSSTIIFSDSTKTLENVVVYRIAWDSTKVYMNEHFKRSIDSIVLSENHEISNQSFYSLNGLKTYRFDTTEFEPFNNVLFIITQNYIESPEKKGHLTFTYNRVKKELSKTDSTLTNKIMKTIKWK